MNKHVTVVAVLYLVTGVLYLAAATGLLLLLLGVEIVHVSDEQLLELIEGLASYLAAFFLVLALPAFPGAIGLLRHRAWARVLLLVLAFLNLMVVPVGTLVGVYAIYVLMHDDADRLFRKTADPALLLRRN